MAKTSLNPVGPTTTLKKNSSSRKQRNHPATWDMVKAALLKLKDRNGSSRQALTKYIETNYDVKLTEVYKSVLRRTLAKAVTDGKLLKNKASFKLSPTEKLPINKAKKPVTKKLPLKKPATLKKAAAATTSVVKKTKKTATAKPTVKKTTATVSTKSQKVGTHLKKRLAKKTVKKSVKSKQK